MGHRRASPVARDRRGRSVGRILRLTPRYARALRRLRLVGGTDLSRALGAELDALSTSGELPGPSDHEVLLPPVSSAWIRRVRGFNLWLFYRCTETEVIILTVSTSPPVPRE